MRGTPTPQKGKGQESGETLPPVASSSQGILLPSIKPNPLQQRRATETEKSKGNRGGRKPERKNETRPNPERNPTWNSSEF